MEKKIQPINTLKHLAFILKIRESELIAFSKRENVDKKYLEHIIPKYNKQTGELLYDKYNNPRARVINPSIGRLKVIQKRILTNILNEVPMPVYAYGGVKKKDNVMNAQAHLGNKYKFVTDLRSFFPSVTHKMVYEMFISLNFSPDVSRCLTSLTTHKGHVPQGACCSSMITNLVFEKTGDVLFSISRERGIIFTSFVDDLTFSSNSDFKSFIPTIIDILYAGGFILSHNKTSYKAGNLPVTGVYCQYHKLSPLKSFLEKIDNIQNFNQQQAQGLLMYKRKIDEANKNRKIKESRYILI